MGIAVRILNPSGHSSFATLSGTEKQIVWAEKIRDGVISTLLDARAGALEDDKPFADLTIAWLASVTDARFWIEMRSGLIYNPDPGASPALRLVCTADGQRNLTEIARKGRFTIPTLPDPVA